VNRFEPCGRRAHAYRLHLLRRNTQRFDRRGVAAQVALPDQYAGGKGHKKSATTEGCAEVPPKEEDLEECVYALGEHRHEIIMPKRMGRINLVVLPRTRDLFDGTGNKTNANGLSGQPERALSHV